MNLINKYKYNKKMFAVVLFALALMLLMLFAYNFKMDVLWEYNENSAQDLKNIKASGFYPAKLAAQKLDTSTFDKELKAFRIKEGEKIESLDDDIDGLTVKKEPYSITKWTEAKVIFFKYYPIKSTLVIRSYQYNNWIYFFFINLIGLYLLILLAWAWIINREKENLKILVIYILHEIKKLKGETQKNVDVMLKTFHAMLNILIDYGNEKRVPVPITVNKALDNLSNTFCKNKELNIPYCPESILVFDTDLLYATWTNVLKNVGAHALGKNIKVQLNSNKKYLILRIENKSKYLTVREIKRIKDRKNRKSSGITITEDVLNIIGGDYSMNFEKESFSLTCKIPLKHCLKEEKTKPLSMEKLKSLKVAYLDDELEEQLKLQKTLNEIGVSVDLYTYAHEFFERNSEKYDIVIVDRIKDSSRNSPGSWDAIEDNFAEDCRKHNRSKHVFIYSKSQTNKTDSKRFTKVLVKGNDYHWENLLNIV